MSNQEDKTTIEKFYEELSNEEKEFLEDYLDQQNYETLSKAFDSYVVRE